MKKSGLYIHWPFCAAKCPYCDFNSYVSAHIDQARWKAAYLKALDYYAELLPDSRIETIFFGGGTPSLMEPDTVGALLERIQKNWLVSNDLEITLEANPGSVEADRFRAFKAAGVNRVSLGVQALNDADLQFLGRRHNVREALRALDIAAENFARFSFDLIYARPDQSLTAWERELQQALSYARGHLSLYQLSIEKRTPFYSDYAQGKFTMPGEELAADFYLLTQDLTQSAGLPAYEVSNHAAPGEECRHNLIYWRYEDYIGIGPGAHGRICLDGLKHATREHRAPEIWLQRVEEEGCGAHPFEPIDFRGQFEEALIMGLRLREGLDVESLEKRTGLYLKDVLDESRLNIVKKQGWVRDWPDRLALTREGILRLNAILAYSAKYSAKNGCV